MLSRLHLSRRAALALGALLLAAFVYLAVTGLVVVLTVRHGVSSATTAFVVPLGCALVAGALLPAPRTQAWLKVTLAKHFFSHRYDYRDEWLRFSSTLGAAAADGDALDLRAMRAIAQIVDVPGALLLQLDGDLRLTATTAWNWTAERGGCDAALVELLQSGHIVHLDEAREQDDPRVPQWLLGDRQIWAVVPLLHFDRLAGAVALLRPAYDRPLDWEDFDLLRVAGRSVASYLAERTGQEALGELRRFEEFNRRFAFIMHDIKNIVSQLTLVARNAERHADNPEFRADMIATLNASTARMNDLLARLSQHHRARPDHLVPVPLGQVAATVAAAKRVAHPVLLEGDPQILATADPARLETALAHLVQNAIDASDGSEPVTLLLQSYGARVAITVADLGPGMTSDFIRTQLFRPFASTKDGGFGIGAFEARTLIEAMGGNLEVASTIGQGTQFTIWLPAGQERRMAA